MAYCSVDVVTPWSWVQVGGRLDGWREEGDTVQQLKLDLIPYTLHTVSLLHCIMWCTCMCVYLHEPVLPCGTGAAVPVSAALCTQSAPAPATTNACNTREREGKSHYCVIVWSKHLLCHVVVSKSYFNELLPVLVHIQCVYGLEHCASDSAHCHCTAVVSAWLGVQGGSLHTLPHSTPIALQDTSQTTGCKVERFAGQAVHHSCERSLLGAAVQAAVKPSAGSDQAGDGVGERSADVLKQCPALSPVRQNHGSLVVSEQPGQLSLEAGGSQGLAQLTAATRGICQTLFAGVERVWRLVGSECI